MTALALLAAEAAADVPQALTVELFEELVAGAPVMFTLMLVLKYGAGALGLAILVRAYLAWNRRTAGLEPLPEVPSSGATRPYPFGLAAGIALGAYLLSSILVLVVARATEALAPRLSMMAVGLLPAVIATIWMRQRIRRGQMTAPRRALREGLGTFAVATAVSIPLSMLSMFLMKTFHQEPQIQSVLALAIDKKDPSNLWVVAAYGIVLAPLLEETLFRGLLYPAIRDATGGGRRGVWVGILASAALFALVHDSTFATLPLFGLAIVLAWVFEKTDSLATVILGHAFFNASSMVPLLVGRLEGGI